MMQKTTIYLPTELLGWLREESRRTGRSQAEVMREALESYAERRPRRLPASVGLGSDPELSGAEVEDWLQENWHPT